MTPALREALDRLQFVRWSLTFVMRPRYDADLALLAAAADAGARARAQAIEECAQWLADRAKEHERIAIDRITADRADEMALTHKSMSDTYHYAAQNIRALLAPDPSRAPGGA